MYLEHFLVQFGGQLDCADFAQNAESQSDQVVVGVSKVDTDAVGGHHEQLGLLVEELREAEIADALLDEGGAGDELEALHLAEVGLLSRHVDEEQLGHVARPQRFFVFLGYGMRTAKDSRMTAISF